MKRTLLLALLLGLALLGSGCQALSALSSSQPPLTMTIDQITSQSSPGEYALYGQTSLPDGTKFVISALRPLTSSDPDLALSDETIYGTLARSSAIAENGRWQTQLSLWQVSSTGTYQEIWQMQDALADLELSPSSNVEFLMTLTPRTLAQIKQANLKDFNQLGKSPLFQATPDGEPYLEVRKAQPVSLPNSQMAVTVPPIETDASPWDGRSTLAPSSATFNDQPTLPFAENDNLPIPARHSLQ